MALLLTETGLARSTEAALWGVTGSNCTGVLGLSGGTATAEWVPAIIVGEPEENNEYFINTHRMQL